MNHPNFLNEVIEICSSIKISSFEHEPTRSYIAISVFTTWKLRFFVSRFNCRFLFVYYKEKANWKKVSKFLTNYVGARSSKSLGLLLNWNKKFVEPFWYRISGTTCIPFFIHISILLSAIVIRYFQSTECYAGKFVLRCVVNGSSWTASSFVAILIHLALFMVYLPFNKNDMWMFSSVG